MTIPPLHPHHISFRHAFAGLITAISTQPNCRVHITFSACAVIAGLLLKISILEWVVITVTITVGLVVELINTAIEFTVDLLTQEYRLEAKYAKDTAAAAMLIYSLGSVIIAALIFLPRLI